MLLGNLVRLAQLLHVGICYFSWTFEQINIWYIICVPLCCDTRRRTYILPGVFFLRQPPAELAERNSAISGHMVESKCNLKMHVRSLWHPFLIQIGTPKPPFWPFRNFRATLTAYIYGKKYDIHKRTSALQITRGLLHRLKTTWTLVYKRLKIGPQLRKFRIPLHCQASLTEINKRNSTTLC